jgi:hypothetical protein
MQARLDDFNPLIDAFQHRYDTWRPHGALGGKTPQQYLQARHAKKAPRSHRTTKEYCDASATGEVMAQVKRYLKETATGIPSNHDRIVLPRCRDALDRDLSAAEKRMMRRVFLS